MSNPYPAYNKIMNTIKGQAQCYGIKPIVLAVSGGVDSMWMWDFVSKCDVPYVVAHFAHQIRSKEETQLDIDLIEKTAKKMKVPTYIGYGHGIVELAKTSRMGIEAIARSQRYSYLNSIIAKDNISPIIVTAHHADDQVETVIMNLMRGVSHFKLRMVQHTRHRYNGKIVRHILRPFLTVPKQEIIRQATNRKLEWNEDSTNSTTDQDRNWLRNEVIPMLSKRRNITTSILTGVEVTQTSGGITIGGDIYETSEDNRTRHNVFA